MSLNPEYHEKYVSLNKHVLRLNLKNVKPRGFKRYDLNLAEQAKEGKNLFKELNIDLSVKKATGANCFYCYVDYPPRFGNHTIMPHEVVDKIRKILDKAFPDHDDRSNSMTDYFDQKWHISMSTGGWEITEAELESQDWRTVLT